MTLTAALLLLVAPIALYAAARPETFGRAPGGSVYRIAAGAPGAGVHRGLLPSAALTSLLFGQLVVPGVFAAGFVVAMLGARLRTGGPVALPLVLALAAPTWLFTAGLLLDAGVALAGREPTAGERALRAGRLSVVHHAVFLAALTACALIVGREERSMVAALAAYAAASIAQAALLLRAARAVAADR